MKKPGLKKRMEQALEEVGSDPSFARDLIHSLRAQGVTVEASTRYFCTCFPREKKPRKTKYGKYTCAQCGRYIDYETDQRLLGGAHALVMPVAGSK